MTSPESRMQEMPECRAKFEQEFGARGYDLRLNGDGDYFEDAAVFAWAGWQAAWSARTMPDPLSEQWVIVDDIKNVPAGVWLVYLEKPMMNSRIHSAHVHPNISTVSSVFAFDAPKVLAYLVQPNAPHIESLISAEVKTNG